MKACPRKRERKGVRGTWRERERERERWRESERVVKNAAFQLNKGLSV